MMMKTKVHNLIIVDASGSMGSIYNQALSGINETLNTIRMAAQKHTEVGQYVSLLSFASGGECLQYVYIDLPIALTRTVTSCDYELRGMTALYDAIGISVSRLKPQVENGDRVLVTIITDGYENDSREWTGSQLLELINELKKEGWRFTYIGANQDVEAEAAKVGIGDTMCFEATQEGTDAMFERERRARLRWNECVSRNVEVIEGGFFEEDCFCNWPQDRVTPERVKYLNSNEVFVFGSNVKGIHSGNASLAAVRKFGAVMGVAEGLQGQSYAIPTVGLSYRAMKKAVYRFVDFARMHQEIKFWVTRIGCGTAGYSDREMAALFIDAKSLPNVSLPQEWWALIDRG